jgi:nucleotidyltransferase substrate binding protein (TIGR01987 family)
MSPSEIRLQQFSRALTRLKEVLNLPRDSVVRDACIQRFEFTFETAWKAIQADVFKEGTECASPRDCLRTAFRLGILDPQESDWLKMVEDRNRTAHTYDEETAEEICQSLPRYSELFQTLLTALEDREQRRAAEENSGGNETSK